MTDRFWFARRSGRWASGFAALLLLFALFPAAAGQCAPGTRACPMAMAARLCACCRPRPHDGAGLAPAPCPTPRALPSPRTLPALDPTLAQYGATAALPRHAALPVPAAEQPRPFCSDTPPPLTPPHSRAPSRAPPAAAL